MFAIQPARADRHGVLVSIGDVVKSLLHDLQLEANVLRDVYRATQSRLTWPENHARP